ncbi:MAG: hypothetical protein Q8Q37_00875 [bacterium]|nr:hypothetical protein [bacterium]
MSHGKLLRALDKGCLPKGFQVAKPIAGEPLNQLLNRTGFGQIVTRKRNGWKVYVLIHKTGVKFFTSNGNEIDDRLIHLKQPLLNLRNKKPTLLFGELHLNENNRDNIYWVETILKTRGIIKAQDLQNFQYSHLHLTLLGVVVYEGNVIINKRFVIIRNLIQKIANRVNSQFVIPMTILKDLPSALAAAEIDHWEGLVIYDLTYQNTYSIGGRTPRLEGCYKHKPIKEGDFIITERILYPGTRRVREVVLHQFDPQTSGTFNCGKFGCFNESTRRKLARIKLPAVIEMSFTSRHPSGALCEARFIRIRADKTPVQCIAPRHFENVR